MSANANRAPSRAAPPAAAKHHRVVQLALAGALAGCAYQPGSFRYAPHEFPGQRATVGCLDIAIERRADLPIGPVLSYQFANRCDRAAVICLPPLATASEASGHGSTET